MVEWIQDQFQLAAGEDWVLSCSAQSQRYGYSSFHRSEWGLICVDVNQIWIETAAMEMYLFLFNQKGAIIH